MLVRPIAEKCVDLGYNYERFGQLADFPQILLDPREH